MNDIIRDIIENKYVVQMEQVECEKCHGITGAFFFTYDPGHFEVDSICLYCGHRQKLRRIAPDEPVIDRLNTWANKVKARDDWRCRICGRPAGQCQLQAHHIIPRYRDPEMKHWFKIDNGIALCKECHMLAHAPQIAEKYGRR